MHDGSEAYLVDVPRPIKGDLVGYGDIEMGVMRALAARFDFPWPPPAIVKAIDEDILNDEMAQNMAPPPAPWRHGGTALGITLQYWSRDRAALEFLRAFSEVE
jgi:hypothetical protein